MGLKNANRKGAFNRGKMEVQRSIMTESTQHCTIGEKEVGGSGCESRGKRNLGEEGSAKESTAGVLHVACCRIGTEAWRIQCTIISSASRDHGS